MNFWILGRESPLTAIKWATNDGMGDTNPHPYPSPNPNPNPQPQTHPCHRQLLQVT